MAPVEREVARKLHGRLSSSGLKGHALLRDCLRHRELVLRPTVFAELAPAHASNPNPEPLALALILSLSPNPNR